MNKFYKHLWTMAIAILPVFLVVTSCDDEETLKPAEIEFSSESLDLAESGTGQAIVLPLSQAAGADGTIEVEISSTDAEYGDHFITSPAGTSGTIVLEVAKGQTNAQFTITPVDNELMNDARTVTFTLANPSKALELGTQTELEVTLTDDEGPTQVNFWSAESSVAENAPNAASLTIELTAPSTGTGTTTVNVTSNGVYGTDFTTTPAVVDGKITLETAVGDEEETIVVTPTNNSDVNETVVINFTISDAEGAVELGTDLTHELTISDDEIPATSIADLRAMHTGSDVTLAAGTNIRGIVTSDNDNLTSRNLYLQDATGAILVRFATDNTFAMGDDLAIDLSGATLTSFNGNLQLAVANDKATKKGTAALPAYQTVTVTQFNSNLNSYEGELVQIQNVGFVDADGTLTMNGSRTASDGTTTFVVRSESYSPWQTTVIPYGVGTIRGIATEFNGVSQIVPQVYAEDVVLSTAGKSITVNGTITDFGSVTKGSTSASQSFTVSGSGLVADVVITAPANFTVSKNNTDFSSSVSFTAAEASASQTVYVKFAPNSGIDGAINGSISIKSIGAEAKTVAVSGTEAGNTGGATRVMNENFDYTVATALTANGWTQSGTTTTNPISVISGGLSFTGYPASGGAGVGMTTSGQDVYKSFTSQTTGDVYLAFLSSVSAAQSTGDYFIAFSPSTTQTNYYARVHIKSSGAGYVVGVKKNNETATGYGSTVLNFNTTYLFVVKYSFNSAAGTDDAINVYVFEGPNAAPATEPGTAEVSTYTEATKADAADLGFVTLRQGTATSAPTLTIDGIRVAKLWADLFN